MRVIDVASPKESRRLEGLNRMRSLVRLSQPGDVHAQEVVIATFQRILDQKYTLLRNASVPGVEEAVPLILAGPPGVWVINANPTKGVFRAREETWEEVDERSQSYQPARVNLLSRTLVMAQAVNACLASLDFRLPGVEPALVFSEPGVHVETNRPAVRIVLVDALERFAASIVQGRAFLSPLEIQKVTDALLAAAAAPPPEEALPLAEEAIPVEAEPVLPRRNLPVLPKLNFTPRQWKVIAVLVVVNILILIILITILLLFYP